MAELLTDEQLDEFMNAHPAWGKEGKSIARTFELKDFNDSMGFVIRVGLKAERMFHHADIDIRWNKVTLVLSTHSEGGLTEMDTELAAFCDGIV